MTLSHSPNTLAGRLSPQWTWYRRSGTKDGKSMAMDASLCVIVCDGGSMQPNGGMHAAYAAVLSLSTYQQELRTKCRSLISHQYHARTISKRTLPRTQKNLFLHVLLDQCKPARLSTSITIFSPRPAYMRSAQYGQRFDPTSSNSTTREPRDYWPQRVSRSLRFVWTSCKL